MPKERILEDAIKGKSESHRWMNGRAGGGRDEKWIRFERTYLERTARLGMFSTWGVLLRGFKKCVRELIVPRIGLFVDLRKYYGLHNR